jgi:hypothetical protein
MSDFILNYGSEEAGASNSFNPGLNSKVSLVTFEFVKDDSNEYLQLVFEKEGGEIRDRIYSPKNFIPKKKRDGSMESDLEARGRIWGEINAKIKHIITNYISEEDFDNMVRDARVSSFQQFVSVCKRMLPPNYKQMKGDLIVGYNQKGYLSIPYAMWVTGRFFSVNNVKGELVVSKNLKLVKEEENLEPESNQEPPISWLSNDNDESEIKF